MLKNKLKKKIEKKNLKWNYNHFIFLYYYDILRMKNKINDKKRKNMKKSFLNRTLKGTKFYIVLILILSAIYSRLLVYIPMFIQYALDGVIMENESVIPNLIRDLFYSNDKISKIIVLVLVLIISRTCWRGYNTTRFPGSSSYRQQSRVRHLLPDNLY